VVVEDVVDVVVLVGEENVTVVVVLAVKHAVYDPLIESPANICPVSTYIVLPSGPTTTRVSWELTDTERFHENSSPQPETSTDQLAFP